MDVDGKLFIEIWEAAKLAGPFGTLIMAFVWWRTDSERKHLQKERDGLLERMLLSMTSATDAIKENTQAILLMDRRGGRWPV